MTGKVGKMKGKRVQNCIFPNKQGNFTIIAKDDSFSSCGFVKKKGLHYTPNLLQNYRYIFI